MALTNRQLTAEQALWLASDKLQQVSGINILDPGLEKELKSKVKDMDKITHVYFFGESSESLGRVAER